MDEMLKKQVRDELIKKNEYILTLQQGSNKQEDVMKKQIYLAELYGAIVTYLRISNPTFCNQEAQEIFDKAFHSMFLKNPIQAMDIADKALKFLTKSNIDIERVEFKNGEISFKL